MSAAARRLVKGEKASEDEASSDNTDGWIKGSDESSSDEASSSEVTSSSDEVSDGSEYVDDGSDDGSDGGSDGSDGSDQHSCAPSLPPSLLLPFLDASFLFWMPPILLSRAPL